GYLTTAHDAERRLGHRGPNSGQHLSTKPCETVGVREVTQRSRENEARSRGQRRPPEAVDVHTIRHDMRRAGQVGCVGIARYHDEVVRPDHTALECLTFALLLVPPEGLALPRREQADLGGPVRADVLERDGPAVRAPSGKEGCQP